MVPLMDSFYVSYLFLLFGGGGMTSNLPVFLSLVCLIWSENQRMRILVVGLLC